MKHEKIKKAIKLIAIILLIILKIYLVSVQPINYKPEKKYDDELMVRQADSILKRRMVRKI